MPVNLSWWPHRSAQDHQRLQRHSVAALPSILGEVMRKTIAKWLADSTLRYGSSLAYYTAFSTIPLLVLIVAVGERVLGHETAEAHLIEQLQVVLGERSSFAIRSIIEHWQHAGDSWFGWVVTLVTVSFAATGALDQLQHALNTIWGVRPKPAPAVSAKLRQRFFSLLGLFGAGFLLVVSLTFSAGLDQISNSMGTSAQRSVLVSVLISAGAYLIISLMFAMIFKLLPKARVSWGDVWMGALVTGGLFMLGKTAIVVYLGNSVMVSLYGGAGSLVIILLWAFFSAQVLLFGAQFTAVYACDYGSRIRPTPDADAVAEPARSGRTTTGPEERRARGVG